MGYIESYIAFLDILGFKKIIEKYPFEEIYTVFEQIKEAKEGVLIAISRACEENDTSLMQYNESLKETKINIMSDSIVISTPCKYKESLSAIIDICWFIQYMLYELKEPILLRGAVAKGNMYQNGEIMFGKGMVDAYLMQEKNSIYPRIILEEKLLEDLKDKLLIFDEKSKIIIDDDGYYYIDCLYEYFDLPSEVFRKQNEDKIYDYVEKTIQLNSDNKGIIEKMIWMQKEYKRCRNLIEEKYKYSFEDLK